MIEPSESQRFLYFNVHQTAGLESAIFLDKTFLRGKRWESGVLDPYSSSALFERERATCARLVSRPRTVGLLAPTYFKFFFACTRRSRSPSVVLRASLKTKLLIKGASLCPSTKKSLARGKRLVRPKTFTPKRSPTWQAAQLKVSPSP